MKRLSAGAVLLGLGIAVAGCQSGGGVADVFSPSGNRQSVEASGDAIRESELRAFCPPVTLREGTAYYTTYQPNGDGDPQKVIYQAAIGDVTRACRYGNGGATMTVAVAGRVVPGPQGKVGTVTVPIRVAVLRGEEVAFSQLYNHPVDIADTSGATQFIFNEPNLVVPGGVDRSVRVMVGYDPGPQS